jgi:hypothetical protein
VECVLTQCVCGGGGESTALPCLDQQGLEASWQKPGGTISRAYKAGVCGGWGVGGSHSLVLP